MTLQHRLSWSQRRLQRMREDAMTTNPAGTEIRQLEQELPWVPASLARDDYRQSTSLGSAVRSQRSLAELQKTPKRGCRYQAASSTMNFFACVINGASVRPGSPRRDGNAGRGTIRRVQFQMDAMRTSRLLPPQHVLQLEARGKLCSSCDLIWAR